MKKILLILLLASAGLRAQTVNEATIRAQINALLTTNANKSITGATHRQLMNLMVTYIKSADSTGLATKLNFYSFATYEAAAAGMVGKPGGTDVYVVADEVNNGGQNGWYKWNGTTLKEVLVL